MRELYGYDGHDERRRHARDAREARDAAADGHAARPHDGPRHAAQHAAQRELKLKMLLDPEARLRARREAEARDKQSEAAYQAKHAKPGATDGPDREPTPERAPLESRDKPASKIAAREDQPDGQRDDRPKEERQRSRLPRPDAVKGIADIMATVGSIAVALGDLPSKWDAVAALAGSALVSNLIWAHRRWKERHGHRPED